MASKSKQTKQAKTESVKDDQFDPKVFHSRVENLIQELMTYTLRGTSLNADIPADQEVVERLYEQIREGYTILAIVDEYVGQRLTELTKFMFKLTKSRHQHNMQAEAEPEPKSEENVINENEMMMK